MKSLNYKKPNGQILTIASEPEALYVNRTKVQEFNICKFELLCQKLPLS